MLVGAGKATRARAEHHEDTSRGWRGSTASRLPRRAPQGLGADRGRRGDGRPAARRRDRHGGRARSAEAEIEKCVAEIRKVDAKLANASFVAKAPPEVVEENRERRAGFEATMLKLQAALKRVEAAL